jgi:FtsP/CotA-like multicopper oxidase with cupredoxin domain
MTAQWILLDHLAAVLSVAAWFAASVTVALRRVRLGLGLLAVAALATLTRLATVALLAGRGWWFVQEKVLLGLPMLAVASMAAVLIAGRPLLEAWRTPDRELPGSSVIAVLTAAYAALAGLVVTFLVGYPLTWGTALITVSAVCAAALLTARIAAPDAAELPDTTSRLSRRRFLTVAGGVVVAGAAGTSAGRMLVPAEPVATRGGSGNSSGSRTAVSVADLRGARTPAPGGIVREHLLTARRATVRLPSGREIEAWTYSGQVPGPTITATQGDLIQVTLRNADIDDGVTVHWHGYDLACGEDGAPGVTQHVVAPGDGFDYRFRADQVGTFWYHTHQASHVGVRRGLYGTLVVHPRQARDADELDLTLPVHTFDRVVVLGDRDGRTEHTVPAGTPVRLRLINTDSDPHRFALAGTPFRVSAVDGRDLNQPGEVRAVRLRLPAGGRLDVVFAMPDSPVSLVVDHDRGAGVRLLAEGTNTAPAVEDTSGWPELDLLRYGSPAAAPPEAGKADRHFTLVLDRGVALVDGRPTYAHTVNGRGHPSIPDQLVTEGELVRFTVVNRSLETHPWHLHGHAVLVLSRDGTRPSGSPLWVDTFDVRPGEVWEVAFTAANPGIWMNHCHNLPHAHQGMMLRLAYHGVSTPFGDAHATHG